MPTNVLPIKNAPTFLSNLEGTPKTTNATKRSSSVGAASERLSSKSPSAAERSTSETSVSLLRAETSQESVLVGGARGRTPPRLSVSPNLTDYQQLGETSTSSSTLPPNNPFYCPIKSYNEALGIKKFGGELLATKQFDRITRAAMAQSHRGIVESGAAAPSAQSALQHSNAHGLMGPSEEPPSSAAHGGTGGDTTYMTKHHGETRLVLKFPPTSRANYTAAL